MLARQPFIPLRRYPPLTQYALYLQPSLVRVLSLHGPFLIIAEKYLRSHPMSFRINKCYWAPLSFT